MPSRSYVVGIFVMWIALLFFLVTPIFGPATISGMVIGASGPFNLTFVSPSPVDGSIINAQSVIINVSADRPLSVAVLSGAGENRSMNISGNHAFTIITGVAQMELAVYAMDNESNSANSQSLSFSLGYINWTPITSRSIPEDTPFNIDLWDFLAARKPRSELSLSLTQDRSDRLSCGLVSARYLNCTSVPNAAGPTSITVSASDGLASSSVNLNVTLLQINDPPIQSLTVPDVSLFEFQDHTIDLRQFFSDVDGDLLTYLPIINSSNLAFDRPAAYSVRFSPNATALQGKSVNVFQVGIIVNDSQNATWSNNFTVAVKQNLPPEVITHLTALSLNNTKAYSLKFYQLFRDPEGDEMVFSSSNLSIAKVLRSGNTLLIFPLANRSGTEAMTFSAYDGVSTTNFSMPVTMTIVSQAVSSSPTVSDESSSAASSPATTSSTSSASTTSASDSSQVPIPASASAQVSVPSTENAQTQSSASPTTVPVQVPSLAPLQNLAVQPANPNGPVKLKDLPPIEFGKDNTEVQIDLSEYWSDPTGNGLDFIIEPKKGFITKVNEHRIAVISLSPSSDIVGNDTIKILAKDPSGNIVSGMVGVSVTEAFKKNQDNIDLTLQLLIIAVVVVFLVMVGKEHIAGFFSGKDKGGFDSPKRVPLSMRPVGSGRFSRQDGPQGSLSEMPSWRSAFSSSKGFSQRRKSAKPSEESVWASGLLDSFFNRDGDLPQEPLELRGDSLRLKEAVAVLQVLANHCEDDVIRSALSREQDRLEKAVSIIRGKSELSRSEMKRLMLLVNQGAVCLVEIRKMIDESLLSHELSKEIARVEMIARDLQGKLLYILSQNED